MDLLIIEDLDFELCDTHTEALHSRPTLKFLEHFLNNNFNYKISNKLYKTVKALLYFEGISNEEILSLELFLSNPEFIKDIISYGDDYIKNNVLVGETKRNHTLTAKGILKVLNFYLLKAKVNKNINDTLNYLNQDECNMKTDEDKEGKEIYESEKILVYSLGKKLFVKNKRISSKNLEFDNFEIIEGKGIIVNNGKNKGLLDFDGSIILSCDYSKINIIGDLVHIRKNNKNGVFDLIIKEIIIKLDNENIFISQNDGLIFVNKGGKWGAYTIGNYKQYLLNPKFDEPPRFEGENFFPKIDGKIGIFSKNGEGLIPCNYNNINLLDNNFAKVKDDIGLGIYKFKGVNEEVIKCGHKDIDYKPGVGFIATLKDGVTKGVFGLNGEIILSFIYKNIYYTEGLGFLVQDFNNKWGFYNLVGKEIFACVYSNDQIKLDDNNLILKRIFLNNIIKKRGDIN